MKIANIRPTGTNTARVTRQSRGVDNAGQVGASLVRLANTGAAIGDDIHAEEMAKHRAKIQLDKDLDQAQTANATLDYEIYTQETATNLENDIASGAVHYNDANSEYQKRMKKAPKFKPSGQDRVLSENYNRGVQRTQFQGSQKVGRAATTAMQSDYKNQFGIAVEKMQKLAGIPGANIAHINSRVDSLVPLAKKAGMADDVIQKQVQTFKDNNWYNQAAQVTMQVSDDREGLKAMRHELTDPKGLYHDKLDATKRTTLLKSLDSHLDKLDNRATHAADKHIAAAGRAIEDIDKQVASGVPATPQQWLTWHDMTKGTEYEDDFTQHVQNENEVQNILRTPIEEQMAFLQKKEQDLATNGGDLSKQANVKRIATAVNNNVKMLKEDPLLFNQNRTGQDVTPLDLSGMADGQSDVFTQLKDRFDTVKALQHRYGHEVSLNPWLPQESQAMKIVLEKADDETKLEILSALAGTSPDSESYGAALKAVSADKGMLMLAGMAKYHDLRGPDGRDVAKTILSGERILDDKSVIMPTESAFRVEFEALVGNAIPDGAPQRIQAFNAFKTIYAGMAYDEDVRHSNEDKNAANQNLAEKAVALATGGITKHNGEKVIMPYGMGQDSFENKLNVALKQAADSTGYPLNVLEDMPIMQAPGLEDAYVILNGNKIQLDKEGKPITLIINDGSVSGKIRK